MRKRLLSLLLALVMVVGLLPASALADVLPAGAPASGSQSADNSALAPQTSSQEAGVEVTYGDLNRTTATVTYHKEGIQADSYNLIFLVDLSQGAGQAHSSFEMMMRNAGIDYIFDYGAQSSTVQLIAYQRTVVQNSGLLDSAYEVSTALGDHRGGSGNANAEAALEAALTAVQTAKAANGNPTVVFWVLGDSLGGINNEGADATTIQSTIESKLDALNAALGTGDALITWQMAAEPNTVLAAKATSYTPAHESAVTTAAYAAATVEAFQEGLGRSLEQVVHDHYHDISFTLSLAGTPTLVEGITDAQVVTDAATPEVSATVLDAKTSVNVQVGWLCRQSDVDFVLELDLDEAVYETQTVLNAQTVQDSHDSTTGTGGGLHTGLFDEDTEGNLQLDLPSVLVDRTRRTLSFPEGTGIAPIQALPGQPVALPGEPAQGLGGNAFGGWGSGGLQYSPGQIIPMPEVDTEFTALSGGVTVELDVGDIVPPEAPGNQMRTGNYLTAGSTNPLYFNVTGTDGAAITHTDITAIQVVDETLTYTPVSGDTDPDRVNLVSGFGEKAVVYARHIGETDNDKVVAYLALNQGASPATYTLYLAGPGGVAAPRSSAYLFTLGGTYSNPSSVTTITLTDDSGEMLLDTSGTTKMNNMFYNCGALTSLDVSGLDTAQVTDMGDMFYNCQALTSLDVSNWNTSNVIFMERMFYNCQALDSLTFGENWNTSKVRAMNDMFYNCQALTTLDLSSWNTSTVLDMGGMFSSCRALTSVTFGAGWDTAKVTDMGMMFHNCQALTSVTFGAGWDTAKVTDMGMMFHNCQALTSVTFGTGWDTSSVTSMGSMFANCYALTSLDLSGWNTAKVTDMGMMFHNCQALTSLDVSGWNTAQVTDMSSMFNNCYALTSLDVSGWNTSSVTNMEWMFRECRALTSLDLSSWDTAQVTNMREMFYYFASDVEGGVDFATLVGGAAAWDMSSVTEMRWMFHGSGLTGEIQLSLPKVETMDNAFQQSGFTEIRLSEVGAQAANPVTDLSYLFNRGVHGPENLQTIELELANASNLTDLTSMFNYCNALTSIRLTLPGSVAESATIVTTNMFTSVPRDCALTLVVSEAE